MRDLPGFYYDEERKRYFPESSRPQSVTTRFQDTHPALPIPGRRKWQTKDFFTVMRRSYSKSVRDQVYHSLVAGQTASSSSSVSVHVPIVYSAHITSLCVSDPGKGQVPSPIFLGDRQGWCYVSEHNGAITPEDCLNSEITAVQSSEQLTVYASFGPKPQILVRSAATRGYCILRPSQLQDVRTARLYGRSLTLGMRKKALHIADLDNPRVTYPLETNSDVFALHRDNHDVWAGTRNGTVRLFDLRINYGQDTLGGRFRNKHVSITHIQRVHEHHLLIAAMDGSLEMFDVRFVRQSAALHPLLSLKGHVNTYTYNLGMAIDPPEDFLFAAGQDNQIRGWSLRNGHALEPPLSASPEHNLFSRIFAHRVHAMQITSNTPSVLWVGSGTSLECFELCKRAPPYIS